MKNAYGETALLFAIRWGLDLDLIRVLIDAGANVNDKTDDGWTLLMDVARLSKKPEVIALLLEAGADATVRNSDGKLALDYARENPALVNSTTLQQLEDASK